MKITLEHGGHEYMIDLAKPLDISISLRASDKNPLAWYVDPPTIKPIRLGPWVGSVEKGGSVNFNHIGFAPHAHGTHTECVGHITDEFESVDRHLNQYFFLAEVLTVAPETHGDDLVISTKQLKDRLEGKSIQALVLRTLPNTSAKKKRHYDYTNWPYLLPETAAFIRDLGIDHLLVDLPSVDKEEDAGALLAHRAFWDFPEATRYGSTITELIYVRNAIKDGAYLLNLQVAPFDNNASPSRPVLFAIDE